MPGFNQRGPMNEGPMTGRRRGVCTGVAADPGQGFSGRGYGRGFGRRGSQVPGWGRGYGQWASPAMGSVNQDALQNRVNMLEAELSAVKNQLRNLSEEESSPSC